MSAIPAGAGASAGLGEHAVAIDGSMAGLLTARVLSDHFDRVTIFEADTPPEQALARCQIWLGEIRQSPFARGASE